MDNHFVPNLTLGLPVVEAIRRATDLPLDLHLMIEDADRWAPGYAEAGAESVTFHAEARPRPSGWPGSCARPERGPAWRCGRRPRSSPTWTCSRSWTCFC